MDIDNIELSIKINDKLTFTHHFIKTTKESRIEMGLLSEMIRELPELVNSANDELKRRETYEEINNNG